LTATDREHCVRGDILGALVTILDNPPYGPNVDEAKVTMAAYKLGLSDLSLLSSLEFNAANSCHGPQQHKGDRYPECSQIASPRGAGYSDEVFIQGHGYARLGRRQWQRPAGLAREGVPDTRTVYSDLSPNPPSVD
jgi:hypothetical protein